MKQSKNKANDQSNTGNKVAYFLMTLIALLGLVGCANVEIPGIDIINAGFLAIALMCLGIAFITSKEQIIKIVGNTDVLDWLLYIGILVEIASAVIEVFISTNGINLSPTMGMTATLISLLIIKKGKISLKREYINLCFFICVLMSGVIVAERFIDASFIGEFVRYVLFLTDKDVKASILLFSLCITVYFYIKSRDGLTSGICIVTALIVIFGISTACTGIVQVLGLVILVLFPILLVPYAETVRRTGIITALYLLILSNVTLLPILFENLYLKMETNVSLEWSVYIDMSLAILGIVFFQYYDKIPDGVDKSRLVMKKMHRGYIYVLGIGLLVVTVLMAVGEGLASVKDENASKGISEVGAIIDQGLNGSTSFVWKIITQDNLISAILIISIVCVMIYRAFMNYADNYPKKNYAYIVLIIVALEMLTIDMRITTMCLYMVFGLYAVCGEELGVQYTRTAYVAPVIESLDPEEDSEDEGSEEINEGNGEDEKDED